MSKDFDILSYLMGKQAGGGGGGGGGSGGGYDIVLRLNTFEGDLQSITQISMDFAAVIAKAEALQPITALVYIVEQAGDLTSVSTSLATTQVNLYQGSIDGLSIVTTGIGVQGYKVLAYDSVEDEWFED